MTEYTFKCGKCGEEFIKEFDSISDAIKHHGIHSKNGCRGIVRFRSPFLKFDSIKNSTCTSCKNKNECFQTPDILALCQVESLDYRLRTGKYGVAGAVPVDSIASEIFDYNTQKLNKIEKSTCTSCKFKDECKKSPKMLAICQLDSFEFRMRTGKYGVAGTGGEVPEDIKGVIVDGTSVYIEDIKRLFIARWDTYNLYEPKDWLKEKPEAPQTKQPLTDDVILRALIGSGNPPTTIGFLPLDPKTGLYMWICYDVDKDSCERTIYTNPRDAVDKIVKLLKEWYGLTGYVEESGSQDSYHVWIFIEPTDKEIVYRFDENFKNRCDHFLNQAFCKRVETGDGRMIRMVYSINYKNGKRSKFLGDLHQIQPEKLPVIEALK